MCQINVRKHLYYPLESPYDHLQDLKSEITRKTIFVETELVPLT